VKTGTVEYQELTDGIRATGTVAVDETRVSYVQLRFSGYIRTVFANATYQVVRKGQPLFTVYSPDLVQTQKEYLLAHQSQAAMASSGVPGVADGAASLALAAEERLRQWDIPEAEIERLKESSKPVTEITINSPAAGYITERNAIPNLYADPTTRLYTIADLSRVWIEAQVSQDDIGRVKPGQHAEVTTDAYPGQVVRATIESILPQVDMVTRTVKVRLLVANPEMRMKPGMYVNLTLSSNLGRQLVIPASAVFESGLRQVVFIDHGDGNLEPKVIETGIHAGDLVVIRSGLQVHQRIVTSGNFLIDSESQLQASANGTGSSSTPAADAGGSTGVKASVPDVTLKIELSTHPSPAHKGTNHLVVKVSDAAGPSKAGDEVECMFFMAAMPGMGMPAVRLKAQMVLSMAGSYEGDVTLPSGGSWQVTITVKHAGQVLGVRHLTIDAEGGM